MIHRKGAPGTGRDRERLKKSILGVVYRLVALTSIARSNILLHELIHLGPSKVPSQDLKRLCCTRVAGSDGVVGLLE